MLKSKQSLHLFKKKKETNKNLQYKIEFYLDK